MLRRTHEAHLLLKAHGVAMLFFIALTYLFSEYRYSRAVMLYFGILGGDCWSCSSALPCATPCARSAGAAINLRHVLIVGEGRRRDADPAARQVPGARSSGQRRRRARGLDRASDPRQARPRPLRARSRSSSQEPRPDQVLISLPRHQYSGARSDPGALERRDGRPPADPGHPRVRHARLRGRGFRRPADRQPERLAARRLGRRRSSA